MLRIAFEHRDSLRKMPGAKPSAYVVEVANGITRKQRIASDNSNFL